MKGVKPAAIEKENKKGEVFETSSYKIMWTEETEPTLFRLKSDCLTSWLSHNVGSEDRT